MASVNCLSHNAVCESRRSKIARKNTLTGRWRRTVSRRVFGFSKCHACSLNGHSARRCCRHDWQSCPQPMKCQWAVSVVQSHQFHQWMFVTDDSPQPRRLECVNLYLLCVMSVVVNKTLEIALSWGEKNTGKVFFT